MKDDVGYFIDKKVRNDILGGTILSSIQIEIDSSDMSINVKSKYHEIKKDGPTYIIQGFIDRADTLYESSKELFENMFLYPLGTDQLAYDLKIIPFANLKDAVNHYLDNDSNRERKYLDIVQVYKPSENLDIKIQ